MKKEVIDSGINELFDSISLEEMGKVKLMNRVDTKYVARIDQIESLLRKASSSYYLQTIDSEWNMPYYTCYFDTKDVNMFYEHQRGKKIRQKIRIRQYLHSDTPPFLEIKSKNNKGRTKKKRRPMVEGTGLEAFEEFIDSNSRYDIADLNCRIENSFSRITLVNKEMTERVTIDTNLEFHNFTTGKKLILPEIGIIEWKRDGLANKSELKKILQDLHIHPRGFSKYCMGMAMTDPALKQNRIKAKIRMLSKLDPSLKRLNY